MSLHPINPRDVRYIKLGSGGAFARTCPDRGEIHLGYHEVPHDICAAGPLSLHTDSDHDR